MNYNSLVKVALSHTLISICLLGCVDSGRNTNTDNLNIESYRTETRQTSKITPDDIGKIIFTILQNLDKETEITYLENFLSIEELRAIAKNEKLNLDLKGRNELTSVTKEKWNNRIISDFNEIKKYGKSCAIGWKFIKYEDFVYELDIKQGLKGCEGCLYFNCFNSRIYKIETTWLYDGVDYKLIEIDNLKIHKDL